MKFSSALSLAVAGLAAAAPALSVAVQEKRQLLSSTRNELTRASGSCPEVIFIFARGSTETGNMGTTAGPRVADALEDHYSASNVWVQGVGGDYEADLSPNFLTRGTTAASIAEAVGLFNEAASTCPDASIVAGGYSQGSAVIAGAVEDISSSVKSKVKGVVLFGYTMNVANDGRIPDYPESQTKIFCAFGDLVCTNTLILTYSHFTYNDDAEDEAPEFLIEQIG